MTCLILCQFAESAHRLNECIEYLERYLVVDVYKIGVSYDIDSSGRGYYIAEVETM